jgi:hypothetical protein
LTSPLAEKSLITIASGYIHNKHVAEKAVERIGWGGPTRGFGY